MMDHSDVSGDLFLLAFLKRPREELYELRSDPGQMVNLASEPGYQDIRDELHRQLIRMLEETNDPRVSGHGDIFDQMPYFQRGFMKNVPQQAKKQGYPATH